MSDAGETNIGMSDAGETNIGITDTGERDIGMTDTGMADTGEMYTDMADKINMAGAVSDDAAEEVLQIGSRMFKRQNKTYVMGILNLTPDSFSDGGKWNDADTALKRVEVMLAEGMDILDVGGESTRPGYTQISVQEEIERTAPVIERIKAAFDVPVSLDTYKSGVARAGIAAGADLINDIWGLKYDPDMAAVIAKESCPCCLMHNRKEAAYGDFLPDMTEDLAETLKIAEQAGIGREKILLDPGIGFGKTYEQNLLALKHTAQIKEKFGCPVLLGCSRKSVIGLTLDIPVEERLSGTIATTVYAVTQGCMFVRVHDIRENVQAVRMAEAILNAKE